MPILTAAENLFLWNGFVLSPALPLPQNKVFDVNIATISLQKIGLSHLI